MTTLEQIAESEKSNAALSSVIAAVLLTTFKIIVGLLTNSLGILAEAAHSGLDMVAALVTLIAVRISGKPADQKHTYGHGKVENVSALFETVLLLATCVWIIYESIQRLWFKNEIVEASIWSFIVMGTSIVIDYSRSRILYKAARKHNSQALEADALHFSTDIWSSSVVILGLIGISVAKAFPAMAYLEKADAIAALVVAMIVVYVSVRLGMRTIQALLDSSPSGLIEQVKQTVEAVPGVESCHQIRIRASGPSMFIDMHIMVKPDQHLDEVHAIMDRVEVTLHELVPRADITVHPEPKSDE
jgi:cation diffusion facilitator family transporter